MSVIRAAATFAQLPPAERLASLHALALLLRAAGSLRARGLARTEARLRGPPLATAFPPRRLATLVTAAARVVPGATCLARSIVLARLVGSPAVVCIGVRPGSAELDAHAWVELDGLVLNDAADVRDDYRVIEERPVPAP